MMKKTTEQYTVQLDPEFVKKIDEMAKKLDLSRNQLMRNFLENSYVEAKALDDIGLLPLFKMLRDKFIKSKKTIVEEILSEAQKEIKKSKQ